MQIIKKIKEDLTKNKILRSLAIMCLGVFFVQCSYDDDTIQNKVKIKDFTEKELIKLHGETEKAWRLTEIIVPPEYIDNPSVLNNSCVTDDVYTFSATNNNIEIDLGEMRCFETISEAESFEAKLVYVPYKYNGIYVKETRLILKSCSIKDNGNYISCLEDDYRLSELTEDRMVFSTGATYVGEYTWAYVFEKINDKSL